MPSHQLRSRADGSSAVQARACGAPPEWPSTEGADRLRRVPGGVGPAVSGQTVGIAVAGAVAGDEPDVRVRGDDVPKATPCVRVAVLLETVSRRPSCALMPWTTCVLRLPFVYTAELPSKCTP
ncbi:hypothetical protein ACFYSF_29185 [Streptomyces canus]|uniref:hypothetical protein n=1 Tax=Streptomyces canus TaxID=58343 RepID=UPI003696F9A5